MPCQDEGERETKAKCQSVTSVAGEREKERERLGFMSDHASDSEKESQVLSFARQTVRVHGHACMQRTRCAEGRARPVSVYDGC